jgi:hypothetical protein
MNDESRIMFWAIEAAAYMRLSRSTLAKWRMSGEGPPFHRYGRRLVYYLKQDLDKWVADCDGRTPGKQGS